MHHIFWFVPGKLAGRSGPSKDPWSLGQLREAGIGAVLSVNDGELCHPDDFERAGLSYHCTPLSANAPPEEGDLEHCLKALPRAFELVVRNERYGLATLVHCHSGKDRTGLFLAYYAVRALRVTGKEAIERVRAVRPIAFTAPGWEEFALEVLAAGGA
jgi:protein-tyrosine phosphatase